MLELDLQSEFGSRVDRRLRTEIVAWLVTVRADGTPQPSPIWFLWDGATCLIYSKPNTPKLKNIANNPNVSFHFDGDGRGGDIVILSGTAQIDETAPPAHEVIQYVDKYRNGLMRIGMTAEAFARTYSVALRVTPTRARGH